MEYYQHVPPYPTSPPPMPGPVQPWWKQPGAIVGGVIAVAVTIAFAVMSFFVGFISGGSGGPDRLPPAEKGRSDAQAMVRNHTAGGDVSIINAPPEFACGIAVKGVGFIRFYTPEQKQEYLAACEQEFAALTGQ
ncbi:hypothetical protein [Streptomyces kebangsaanensis]|uniref:hypothetical protein n=1 Tax=Streptomyces kebangsaanensis TaxID=864058 RepID=UPI000A4D5230|nr:hypothetical protein [Streptomyces kebangsaanensis]